MLATSRIAQTARRAFPMKKFSIVVAALIAAISHKPSTAQEAEWGCQVLLCAASSAPSWQGVPYCVPPMVKLITAMKKPGFDWPICPGAGTGEPGKQFYEDCPAGYSPATENDGDIRRSSVQLCAKPDICRGHGDNKMCQAGERIPRPMKANPYYFDISNGEGQTTRAWFNLNY